MSLLNSIKKPVDRPVMVTICGEAGSAKTSLSATFPNPIFIRTEDGLQSIPEKNRPDAFPVAKTTDEVVDQIRALAKEEHEYKTLVIDSVTALERMIIDEIVAGDKNKPKSINQALGGYGAGLMAVAAEHQKVRKACGFLNENKGMNVVFIAHADTETIELPDMDAYTRYTLRLGKRSIAPYTDDVDVVGYLKLQSFAIGSGDKKKAVSDGTRVLVTYATASNVSKNRYGIEEDIVFEKGKNPLAAFIPTLKTTNK
jgi:hypothetical protein